MFAKLDSRPMYDSAKIRGGKHSQKKRSKAQRVMPGWENLVTHLVVMPHASSTGNLSQVGPLVSVQHELATIPADRGAGWGCGHWAANRGRRHALGRGVPGDRGEVFWRGETIVSGMHLPALFGTEGEPSPMWI